MSIDTYLHKRGASATPRPLRSASDRVLAEIAAQAVRSSDAEKLLRTVDYSLRQGGETICIRLDENGDRESPVAVVARRLANVGVLAEFNIDVDKSVLFARISKRCTEPVRERFMGLVQNGRWLEVGAAEVVREVIASSGEAVEVATQVRLTLSDGTAREVDVFVCAGDEALLIECKAGTRGLDGIGRFSELARALGIAPSHTLVLALHLDEEAAADMKAFYPVTTVARGRLDNIVARRISKMVARAEPEKAASPSQRKAEPEKAAPTQQRKTVDPELIESALIAEAEGAAPHASLTALVPRVRDQLGCSRSAVNAVARKLLYGQAFQDEHDDVVRDFSTPIRNVVTVHSRLAQPS